MKKDLEKLDKYLLDAIDNINGDRAVTKMLLLDVIELIKATKDNHKDVGAIAAKYVETLQRSNEQLVKIVSLMQKDTKQSANLSDKDKEELFDIIKEAS
tara:strand:+ start:1083 stop:1379 length:297 start_codon:yes stop_codon:yes gene_type:complete